MEWGPGNPHPLSRMKTEVVREGKYDEYGNRRPVSLRGGPLPLQRIEGFGLSDGWPGWRGGGQVRQQENGQGQVERPRR
jgi:hypothetical protein